MSDTIRLIGMCDPHFCAHSPPSWRDDTFWKETQELVGQVFSYGRQLNVDGYVWAGDIFHLKSQGRNPFWFVAELAAFLRSAKAPHYTIAGNHDLKYGSLKGLKGQPIEMLLSSGVMQLVDVEPPLIQKGSTKVRIYGESYRHGKPPEKDIVKREEGCWSLLMGHFWFGLQEGIFYGERMYDASYFKDHQADIYLVGHHHEHIGVVESFGKTFIAPGSINRTGVHVTDHDRKPAAALIEISDKVEVKMLFPKAKDLNLLIDVERKEKMVQEKEEINQFLSQIQETSFVRGGLTDRVKGMDISGEVKEVILEILEEVEGGVK